MGVGQCHALAWALFRPELPHLCIEDHWRTTHPWLLHGWTVVSKAFSTGPGTQAALRTCYDYVHTIPSPQGQLISLSHLSSRDGNQELTTEPQPRVATWYTGERGPCACLASELSGSQLPSAAPPPPPQVSDTTGPGGNHSKEPPSEGSARARPRLRSAQVDSLPPLLLPPWALPRLLQTGTGLSFPSHHTAWSGLSLKNCVPSPVYWHLLRPGTTLDREQNRCKFLLSWSLCSGGGRWWCRQGTKRSLEY